MPDFQYQPPTGPLSGSEFERQTTRFFQQVQGAADAAQSTAIVAQTTANEALERAQASNFVDGKTTEAGGVITVKDVAIGGNLEDLASARGQIGELKVATATEYPSILTIRKSCRLYFNGTEWAQVADRPFEAGYGAVVIADVSSGALRGEIWAFSLSGNDAWKAQFNEKGTSPFARFVMSNAIGDGIRVNNGIISVPEYDGATASTAGTSGLVPPAAAGQQNHLLTGGGAYISKVPNATHADTADNATHADTADNSLALAGRPWLESLYTDSTGWVIGSVDEKLRPVNTGSLKVYAANKLTDGSFAYGRASDGFTLPNGDSWFVFCILDNDVSHGSVNAIPIIAAGGSHITWSFNGTGYTWIGIKI